MDNMKNKFININWMGLVRVSLVIGITILAYYDKDGWGWLIFALLCTL